MVLDVEGKKATIYRLPVAPAATPRQLELVAAARKRAGAGTAATGPGAEDLGEMFLEGFAVTGSRRVRGSDGTAAEQAGVTEVWFSPELKVELSVISQETRSVTRSTRLTNIVPGEPDPALFQAPADYQVQQGPRPEAGK
jgi:hypothetical protein